MNTYLRLWKEEEGQDLVEYALLVVLISLAAVAAMKGLASGISDAFSNAAANLTEIAGGNGSASSWSRSRRFECERRK